MPTFDEYARGRDLVLLSESPLGTLHITKTNDGTMVRRFDRDWPASLLTTYLDMLEAAQLWIDKQPTLATLLRIERPFEIGDDYYVISHYPHYWSTKHIGTLPPDDDDKALAELQRLTGELSTAVKTVSGERDVLIASILSRCVLTPSAWTFHSDEESRFVVVDPPATRAEGEMWLGHPSWHVNPA
jgi:hypothetical protein